MSMCQFGNTFFEYHCQTGKIICNVIWKLYDPVPYKSCKYLESYTFHALRASVFRA